MTTSPSEHSPEPPVTKTRFRWVMLGLLWFLYACFGITAASIPPLVDPIIEDLGISYGAMGFVLGGWQLIYIATAYPMGTLVDRLGVRKAIGAGIFLIWLSLALRGLAVDFTTLFLPVALFGIGGPLISIGAPKVVAQWFSERERGFAAGIYATAPVAGMVISLATASSVVLSLTGTWRGISIVYGGVVLVAMAAWWVFSREAPKPASAPSAPGAPAASALMSLLRIRNVQLLLVLAIGTFFLGHGLEAWAPSLLRERGLTLAAAGFWTALGTGIGAVIALVISGVTRSGRRVFTMIALLLLSSAATLSLSLVDGMASVPPLMVANWVRQPMMPILSLLVLETRGVGSMRVGSAMGLFFAAAEIGGFGGPFLIGLLRDTTGSLAWGVVSLTIAAALMVFVVPFVKETKERPET